MSEFIDSNSHCLLLQNVSKTFNINTLKIVDLILVAEEEKEDLVQTNTQNSCERKVLKSGNRCRHL